jgi:hypothetical protein
MLQTMRSVGFEQVSWTPYNFGIAGLYRGESPKRFAAGDVNQVRSRPDTRRLRLNWINFRHAGDGYLAA